MTQESARCLKTPITYEELHNHLFDAAQVALFDWKALPHDLNTRLRATMDIALLFCCSLSCDVSVQCRDRTMVLWLEFENWCDSLGIVNVVNPYLQFGPETSKIMLQCGYGTSLDFEEICKTYYITVADVPNSVEQKQQPFVRVPKTIILPQLHDSLLIKLKSVLKKLYVNVIRQELAAAYRDQRIKCKIPLNTSLSSNDMSKLLVCEDNWEDASLFLLLSSSDQTLSALLVSWPFTSEFPETHLRKINFYQTLLRSQFPLLDPMRAFYVACDAHVDYAHAFLTNWATENWQYFCATLHVTSCAMLQILLEHFTQEEDRSFIHLIAQRLSIDSVHFKDMARMLLRSAHAAPLTCDFANIDTLDRQTVHHLLQIAF